MPCCRSSKSSCAVSVKPAQPENKRGGPKYIRSYLLRRGQKLPYSSWVLLLKREEFYSLRSVKGASRDHLGSWTHPIPRLECEARSAQIWRSNGRVYLLEQTRWQCKMVVSMDQMWAFQERAGLSTRIVWSSKRIPQRHRLLKPRGQRDNR